MEQRRDLSQGQPGEASRAKQRNLFRLVGPAHFDPCVLQRQVRGRHCQLGITIHEANELRLRHIILRLKVLHLGANRAGEHAGVKLRGRRGRGLPRTNTAPHLSRSLAQRRRQANSGNDRSMEVGGVQGRLFSSEASPAIHKSISRRRFSSSCGSSTYLKPKTISVEVTSVFSRDAAALTFPPASLTETISTR